MKLQQLKAIFTTAFSLEPTAANARKVLKNEGKHIIRNDFRCAKTWEMMLDSFGLLSNARAFESRRSAKDKAARSKAKGKAFFNEIAAIVEDRWNDPAEVQARHELDLLLDELEGVC